MINFNLLREGVTYPWDGQDMVVVRIDKHRRGGWTRVLLTPDGGGVRMHLACSCPVPDPFPVVDLVVEDTIAQACGLCRKVVSGQMINNGATVVRVGD